MDCRLKEGQGIVNSPGAGARAHMTMGLIVADAQAFAVPAVERPLTDIGSDWLWWSNRSLADAGDATNPTEGAGEMEVTRIDIDNKAMRKMQPNQVLALVLANGVANSTMNIRVIGVLRFAHPHLGY